MRSAMERVDDSGRVPARRALKDQTVKLALALAFQHSPLTPTALGEPAVKTPGLTAVVIPPSTSSAAIAVAVEEAAVCCGVPVSRWPGEDADAIIPAGRRLLVCTDAANLAGLAPERSVIVLGDLSGAIAAAAAQFGLAPLEGLRFSSSCLAKAAALAAERDTMVVSPSRLHNEPATALLEVVRPGDVVIALGAGDINASARELAAALGAEEKK